MGKLLPFIDEFRDASLVRDLAGRIGRAAWAPVSLMEVCGGHTMAIHRNGLHQLLPGTIKLLSGPGCPVCVSGRRFIDQAISLCRHQQLTVATFGDLMRVPGSTSSLEKEKQQGRDIRVVYSVSEAMHIAHDNPAVQVVFLGIGFETTAPSTALAILQVHEKGIRNFSVLSAHKQMPQALEMLAGGETRIDGFIAPGHVSAITGSGIYDRLADTYHRAVVICGFEPADIMMSVLMLVDMIRNGDHRVENQYGRVVRKEGNIRAQEIMARVFRPSDAEWRGLGVVKDSGLAIREEFAMFDAERRFGIKVRKTSSDEGCICGEILTGRSQPADCPLFNRVCSPLNPVGACMVSSEGVCAIHYRYSRT